MKENKIISRREALRRIFTAAGLVAVSPSLMSFYNQLTDPSGRSSLVPDKFFINRVREALKGAGKLSIPPAGSGKRVYQVYSLLFADRPLRKGTILLNHDGDALSAEIRRQGSSPEKFSQFIFIKQKVRSDALLSPVSWTYKSYLAKTVNGASYRTPLEGRGEYDGKGLIAVSEGSATRNYHAPLPTAMKWNLLLAIDSIAKGNLPLEFGLIDEYDLYAGERKIQPYATASVESDGKTIALRSVVMTGPGTLPAFFWLDETGTPLFVNTGTEVYILNG